MSKNNTITVIATIQAPVEKVWNLWINPIHIINWNNALDQWHTPRAENDLQPGGKFSYRMEAKDGSDGFDFSGTYNKIIKNELIDYTLDDDRRVTITFTFIDSKTNIAETFETENVYPAEMQKAGWQAILENFKKYVEKYK
jgi:uncharacterized protein YndB with AHSA1/START domain